MTGTVCYTVVTELPEPGKTDSQWKGRYFMKRRIAGFMLMLLFCMGGMPICADASQTSIAVGGLSLMKTDLTGNPLENAVFQIYRPIRTGELGNRKLEKKLISVDGENQIMVLESFWDNREMTGTKQTEAVTDRSGKTAIYGLTYGTYYLVETRAPEGYNRISDPIRVTVHKYSHLTKEDGICDDKNELIDNTLYIINVRYTLPDTGNLNTVSLAAAGTGIVFSAAALILMNRRRWY